MFIVIEMQTNIDGTLGNLLRNDSTSDQSISMKINVLYASNS